MEALREKITALMNDVGAIGKDGKNNFHGYAYQSHAGIMAKLQPKLVKHGLVMYPETVALFHQGTIPDRKGNPQSHVILKVVYAVTDGTSTIQVTGIGEGVDAGDKASYKAQTGAHKYAIKQLLTLPDEADAEADDLMSPKANGSKGGRAGGQQKINEEERNSVEEWAEAGLIALGGVLGHFGAKEIKDLTKANFAEIEAIAQKREKEMK